MTGNPLVTESCRSRIRPERLVDLSQVGVQIAGIALRAGNVALRGQ